MLLEGSCHCRSIRFRVESSTPYPYQACYCSICRKTAGGGGFAINLGADANTLEVEGREHISVYNAKLYDRGEGDETPASEAERNFCRFCGSFLWLFSPGYPELVHPFASAIERRSPSRPSTSASCWITRRPGARSPRVRMRSTTPSTPRNLWRTGTDVTA